MSYLWWSVLGVLVTAVSCYGIKVCWDANRDLLGPLCIVPALAGLLLVISGIVWAVSDSTCRHQGDVMDVPSDFSLWTSCVVKVGDRWIPLDSYRGTEEQ